MYTKPEEDSMIDVLKAKSKMYDMIAEYGEIEVITAMGEVIKDIRHKRKVLTGDIKIIDDVIYNIIDV